MSFIQSPSGYVSIPYDQKFAPIREAVVRALNDSGVEALEGNNTASGTSWRSSIGGMLERAEFVIADVTGLSQYVLYELGAAYALKKPTFIIAQEGTNISDLPGDLAKLQVVIYKPEDIGDLSSYLRHWVQSIVALSLQVRKNSSLTFNHAIMKNCFVVMPFLPQLHYTFLYLKKHIEDRFPGITCERGDDQVLTVPILEKIAGYIKQADVVIADVSGRNPNVFYELGLAHALEKPVILITADDVKDTPTDIRAFELIRFDEGPKEFLNRLDKALTKVLGNQFDELYDCVSNLFDEFKASKQLTLAKTSKDDFSTTAADIVRANGSPKLEDKKTVATLYLISMVPPPIELKVTKSIGEWIEEKYGV